MTIKISQLGNLTTVYGNTIVPVVANVAGTLTTVKGNLDQLTTYIISTPTAEIANLWANAGIQATTLDVINANIVAANTAIITSNTGMKGYVDGQLTSSNTAMKGYVDGQISAANGAVITSNVGIIGYIDQANTIQSAQVGAANLAITAANVGMTGYVDNSVTTANIGMKGYVDTGVTTANVGMKGYVDNQTYSNVQVASYIPTYSGNVASVTSTGPVVVFGNLYIANVYVPPLANSTGSTGQITYDGDYVYVCVGTDTWRRANLVAW